MNNDGTGKIGRFTFSSGGEFTTTVSNNTAGMGNGTYAFWAGATSANAASAPFRVTYAGAITATSATITGTINATTGTFGNGTNKITVGNGGTANSAIYYGMTTLASTTTTGFYVGTDGIALGGGKFKVTNTGSAVLKDAIIGDPNGYHIAIDSDDVGVYENVSTTVASFGADGAQIGKTSEQHLDMSYNSMKLIDKEGDTFFEMSDERDTDSLVTYRIKGDGSRSGWPLPVNVTLFPATLKVYDGNGNDVSSSYPITCISVNSTGQDYRHSTYIKFDSSHILPNGYTAEIVYAIFNNSLPSISFGEKKTGANTGYISATFGKKLIAAMASQTVLGEYNVEDTEDKYPFIIGNGTSDAARSNALTVDWSGNTVMAGALTTTGIISGAISATGNINTSGTYQKGGSAFITTDSIDLGTISITAGTPGTTSTTITKTITKTGYTPIAVKIRYVSTSMIGFNAFFNSDNTGLYVQVIRRQTGASSPGYKAYADVTYIKT